MNWPADGATPHGSTTIRPTRSGDLSSSVCASPILASGKRAAMRVLMRPSPSSFSTVSMSFIRAPRMPNKFSSSRMRSAAVNGRDSRPCSLVMTSELPNRMTPMSQRSSDGLPV